MTLAERLDRLYARRRFGIRPGVDRVRFLLDRLGNPESTFPAVHVVGTNGKGSTSTFLAGILTSAGLRTGLFTSPHLVDFTERFRIDGIEISPDRLAPLLDAVLAVAPEEATFFEVVTALGVLYFSRERVDIAIMEAGMGGRSDATAALNGIMTVITPVSLDHCDFLGATLESIALEKAGIAKPGTPVVSGHQPITVRQAVSAALRDSNPDRFLLGEDASGRWNDSGTLDYAGLHLELSGLVPGIPGLYQAENASLALLAAEVLQRQFSITEEAMKTGIREACLAGRMEPVAGRPRMILDGAHNPAGITALADSIRSCSYSRLLLVIGVMSDKDLQTIASVLAPLAATCYCVSPNVERAMDVRHLAATLAEQGAVTVESGPVGAGISAARHDAGPEDLILVCGSLFTVGEAKAWLAGKNFEGIRG